MSTDQNTSALWRFSTRDEDGNDNNDAASAVTGPTAPTMSDAARVKLFLAIQILFLLITPFCGGFHFALWSMRPYVRCD